MNGSQGVKSIFVVHDFNKVWRYIPLNRPKKEAIKWVLFSVFPFLFSRWAIYQNWRNAQDFAHANLSFWQKDFWKRSLCNSYRVKISSSNNTQKTIENKDIAVVIHAFYPDVFQDILTMLEDHGNMKLKLYITSTIAGSDKVDDLLRQVSYPSYHKVVENHGRDILPFITVLPKVIDDGMDFILKLHTKKSNHLSRQAFWCSDILDKLIGPGAIERNAEIFKMNANIGLIGPSQHILPMRYYYGANALAVRFLGSKMGLTVAQMHDLHFIAGSMFYARKHALLPLLKLGIGPAQFEPEAGQIDGTMAHAIERAFSLSAIKSGLELADTHYHIDRSYLSITKSHYFSV